MSSTLTFREYRTANETTTYPEQIPSALQTTINDWFDNRYVVDDDYFGIYFSRVLNRDYDRYNQLLRIEPGVSNYDWLVEEYLEAERTHEGTTGQTTNGTTETKRTGTVTTAGETNTTHTGTIGVETTGNATHTGTVGVEGTGTNKTTTTQGGTVTDAGTNNNTQTLDTQTDTTGTDTQTYGHTLNISGNNVKSGSVNRTHTADESTNYDNKTSTETRDLANSKNGTNATEHNTTSKTETKINQGYTDNTANLTKTAPMSVEYAAAQGGTGTDVNGIFNGSGTPSLDWHTLTGQTQAVSSHEPTGTDPDTNTTTNTGTDTTTTSENGTDTGSVTRSEKNGINRNEADNEVYNNITDTQTRTDTNGGSDTTERTGQQKNTGTVTNEGTTGNIRTLDTTSTVNGETSNGQTTTNNLTDATTGNSTTTNNLTDAGTNSGTVTNDLTDTGTTTGSVTGTQSTTDREVHTGRHGEPAVMLQRASNFIKASSAFAWLQKRLEPCFMGIYDI